MVRYGLAIIEDGPDGYDILEVLPDMWVKTIDEVLALREAPIRSQVLKELALYVNEETD